MSSPVRARLRDWGPVALEQLLIVVWLGSLWTVGYLVAPVLFATLPERALAGQVAGRLFTLVAWLGLGCGAALLALALWRWRRAQASLTLVLLPALMLLLVLTGEFGLQPRMAELKAVGESGGAMFARLHGIAALLYLAESLLGLGWLVLRVRETLRRAA